MPKKKLTKTQVKQKIKRCANDIGILLIDKIYHSDSNVPMSKNVLNKLNDTLLRVNSKL